MKEPVQGDLLCNLGGGVLFRLEPAFCGQEQCIHLVGCVRLVGPMDKWWNSTNSIQEEKLHWARISSLRTK